MAKHDCIEIQNNGDFNRNHRNIICRVRACACLLFHIFTIKINFSSIFYDIRDACIAHADDWIYHGYLKKKKRKRYAHNAYDSFCFDNRLAFFLSLAFPLSLSRSFLLTAHSKKVSIIESETTKYGLYGVSIRSIRVALRYTVWLPLRPMWSSSTKTKRFNCHNS